MRHPFLVLLMLLLLVVIAACQAAPTPTPTPTPWPETTMAFARGAFPNPMPYREWHLAAWQNLNIDCMGCHGKEAGEAPTVVHKDLPEIYLTVNCRTCHVPKPPE